MLLNSFFAGIGGFDKGFEQAGISTAFQCEINPFCQRVLEKHWPQLPRGSDINNISVDRIPAAEIWAAGFPCQDISLARGAERMGLKGSRSGLFYRFSELVGQLNPRVVLLENVPGLLSSNLGADFLVILQTLTEMGYAVGWRTLNSRYFGVPQSRERVFILGWKNSPSAVAQTLFDTISTPPLTSPRAGFMVPALHGADGPIVPKVAFCLAATSGRHTGTDWSRTYVAYRNRVRRLTPLEYERLQGFPDEWTQSSEGLFGNAEELDTMRYTALGNAVTVPVIQWIAERMVRAFGNLRPLQTSKFGLFEEDNGDIEILADAAPEFTRKTRSVINLLDNTRDMFPSRWPNAGMAWQGVAVANQIPPRPQNLIETTLATIVERGEVPERYFLSANAARGILRRVEQQNRTLFAPLDAALRTMAYDDSVVDAETTALLEMS